MSTSDTDSSEGKIPSFAGGFRGTAFGNHRPNDGTPSSAKRQRVSGGSYFDERLAREAGQGFQHYATSAPGVFAHVPPAKKTPPGWQKVSGPTVAFNPASGSQGSATKQKLQFLVGDRVYVYKNGQYSCRGKMTDFTPEVLSAIAKPTFDTNETETRVYIQFDDGTSLKVKREQEGRSPEVDTMVRRIVRHIPAAIEDTRGERSPSTSCEGCTARGAEIKKIKADYEARIDQLTKERDTALEDRSRAITTNNTLRSYVDEVALFNEFGDFDFSNYGPDDIPQTEEEIRGMAGTVCFVHPKKSHTKGLVTEMRKMRIPDRLVQIGRESMPADDEPEGRQLLSNIFKYVVRPATQPRLGREVVHAIIHTHCRRHGRILSIGAHSRITRLSRDGGYNDYPLLEYSHGYRGGGWSTPNTPQV